MLDYKNSPVSIKRLAIEIALLVIAVFVALAVDEAWEDLENETAAQQALVRIHQELAQNEERIGDVHTHHQAELERVAPIVDRLEAEGSAADDAVGINLQVTILRDTAWRSAQLTEVLRYLPYEQIQLLATVYGLQDLYRSQVLQVFDYQGNVDFIGADPALQMRSGFQSLQKISGIEAALMDAYGQIDKEAQAE